MDLLTVAGELYALAPQEFTAARDDRARQARADGEKDVAQQIRRLSRPTAAAWVVNTLARGDSARLDDVLALGASLREAQDGAGGEHVRLLADRRRELLAEALARARSLAEEHGHPVSRATADEVETTLRSGVADDTAARAVRSGRLTRALVATGLGGVDVSGAVAVPDSCRPRRRRCGSSPTRPNHDRLSARASIPAGPVLPNRRAPTGPVTGLVVTVARPGTRAPPSGLPRAPRPPVPPTAGTPSERRPHRQRTRRPSGDGGGLAGAESSPRPRGEPDGTVRWVET